jgi:UDP-glucose 4-epimerase
MDPLCPGGAGSVSLSFYEGKKILITGMSGFIGSALSKALTAVSCEVTAKTRGQEWKDCLENIDIVFHLAAQTSAAWADLNPDEDYDANVQPVLNLIEFLDTKPRAVPLTVIFAGSVTQCGIPQTVPVNETHPDQPVTVYDRHKWTAEILLLQAARTGLLKACSLRLPNIYGPGPASSSSDRGVLNQMMARALAGQDLTLYGEGEFTRDYLFLEDTVEAFLAAGAAIEKLNGGRYVLGSGEGRTIREAFEQIAETARTLTGKEISIFKKTYPEGTSPIEFRNFVADTAVFRERTGWSARTPLTDGIRKTMESYSCVI